MPRVLTENRFFKNKIIFAGPQIFLKTFFEVDKRGKVNVMNGYVIEVARGIMAVVVIIIMTTIMGIVIITSILPVPLRKPTTATKLPHTCFNSSYNRK